MLDYNSDFIVSVRGGFSDRNGIKKENTKIQYTSLDNRSRTAICNTLNKMMDSIIENVNSEIELVIWRNILENVYLKCIDSLYSVDASKTREIVMHTILRDDYDSVLTAVEYIAGLLNAAAKDIGIFLSPEESLNDTFEKEYIGYRFIKGRITAITDKNEIDAITEALNCQDNKVGEHLDKASRLLSDRRNPDYENSIKESISAVEALCSEIAGSGTTLGSALKALESNGVVIHPALKESFNKLYGYTNDAQGIRHAGNIDGHDATFEEAKFMLVACSGFVNYLKGCMK